MIADYHIHSYFSADSGTPTEMMIRRALSLGLKEIAITDHLDFEYKTLNPYPYIDLECYVEEVLRLKAKYKREINVVLGLELGLTPEIAPLSDKLLEKYPFDFIICSTHDVLGLGLYSGEYFEGRSKEEAYSLYFSQILETIRHKPDFCVYSHLDYIERYGIYDCNTVNYEEFKECIDPVLSELVSQGKGIEINTSGFRYGLEHTNPKFEIVNRYRELGGEIVTVGSDAHEPSCIALDFDKAEALLKSAGFRHITCFKDKMPQNVLI